METEITRTKHDLYVGNASTDQLEQNFNIGYAFKYDDLDYYLLKLWPLPGTTYYLGRNREGDRYTVFSKIITENGGVRLQNPIGYGVLRPDLKDYIEICLRDRAGCIS